MTFYDLFSAQCTKAGKKPREVAKEAGVKTSTLSMWKTKGVTPKYGTIRQLAAILNTEWTELVPEEQQEQVIVDQVRQTWKSDLNRAMDLAQAAMETDDEKEEREYWESALSTEPVLSLIPLLEKLNEEGRQKAVERVEELTEIPKYQRTDNK